MVRTTSSLIQKQEGEKQALWNRRLGKRVYIDNKFIRSKGHNKCGRTCYAGLHRPPEHRLRTIQQRTTDTTTLCAAEQSETLHSQLLNCPVACLGSST